VLHAERRELIHKLVWVVRSTVSQIFLKGTGIEVGAGDTPFPLPEGVSCYYGDVRDSADLAKYFGNDNVSLNGRIDAQTFAGIPAASQDFVITSHVIEHLYDPIGAIRAAVNVLKLGSVFVCVVPEMTKTWDCDRSPTTLAHLWTDSGDGGESTRLLAHVEHAKYVHPVLTGEHIPEAKIEDCARATMAAGMDLHVHAWRAVDFKELLEAIAPSSGFAVEAGISSTGGNENIFVMRRTRIA
jgi:hypothetical protein